MNHHQSWILSTLSYLIFPYKYLYPISLILFFSVFYHIYMGIPINYIGQLPLFYPFIAWKGANNLSPIHHCHLNELSTTILKLW